MLYKSESKIRNKIKSWENQSVSFIPTMGDLHAGHISLIHKGKSIADKTIVSIFVNPTQFNNKKDFESYTKGSKRDIKILEELSVDAVFMPNVHDIYHNESLLKIQIPTLSMDWEGKDRAGHFEGVLQVVSILFNIIKPNYAIFGEKDFQQLRLVEELVRELHFDLDVVRGELIRADDGLALSSRNSRLSDGARKKALCLSKSLFQVKKSFQDKIDKKSELVEIGKSALKAFSDIEIHYFDIIKDSTLKSSKDRVCSGDRVLAAITVEGVRLLDNIEL